MNSDIFVSVLYVLLAGGLASATSFPPRLPSYVIGWYDYPIIRVILLTLILFFSQSPFKQKTRALWDIFGRKNNTANVHSFDSNAQ